MGSRERGKIAGFGIYKDGDSFRLHVIGEDGKRRALRLQLFGVTNKRKAEELKRSVQGLLAQRDFGLDLDAESLREIDRIHPRIKKFLESAGLYARKSDERTLHACLDKFLDSQKQRCKPSSMLVLGRAVKHAKAHFAASKKLCDTTPKEVADFGNWLKCQRGKQASHLAEATIRKTCSVLCQAFRFAQRNGWVRDNPVLTSGVKRSVMPNKQRFASVSLADARRLIAACDTWEERLMVGFARYAALRIPSEISELRWSHFGHDFGVVEIHAPKTGDTRSVPLMPELRQLLMQKAIPDDRSEFVFPSLRRYPSLSTAMRRIIRKSGIKDYPRALHTLRASCISDWVRQYPSIADVAKWAGHSVPIMSLHYMRIQAEDSALLAAKAAQEAHREGGEGGAESVKAA